MGEVYPTKKSKWKELKGGLNGLKNVGQQMRWPLGVVFNAAKQLEGPGDRLALRILKEKEHPASSQGHPCNNCS